MESAPLSDDIVKLLEDDLPNFAIVLRRHVVRIGFTDFKTLHIKPILTVHFRFARVDVDRLVALVGVKKESPT